MFDGKWGVLNLKTKKYEESYQTKNQALTRVSNLVERDGHFWAVLPLSEEQWKALKAEATQKN